MEQQKENANTSVAAIQQMSFYIFSWCVEIEDDLFWKHQIDITHGKGMEKARGFLPD